MSVQQEGITVNIDARIRLEASHVPVNLDTILVATERAVTVCWFFVDP